MRNTVVAVPNTKQREELIYQIKKKYQLQAIEDDSVKVVQDRVHRVQVWRENKLELQVTVVVVTVHVGIDQLLGYYGDTKFHVDFIKQELIKWIKKMDELSMRGSDTNITKKLVDGL